MAPPSSHTPLFRVGQAPVVVLLSHLYPCAPTPGTHIGVGAGELGAGGGDDGDGETPNTAVYVPEITFGSLYVPAAFCITASSAWPWVVSPSFVSTELL